MAKKEIEEQENKIEEAADNLEIESDQIYFDLEKKLTKTQLELIKKISYNISQVGLPIEEACLVAGIDFEKFKKAVESDMALARLIKLKRLVYKYRLLKTMNKRALEKNDEKMAQVLLEMAFPEEFGKNKRTITDNTDPIRDAINFINQNGDNNPLVSPSAGRSTFKGEKTSILQSIKDLLA